MKLVEFRNLHLGETCYIFGSGSTVRDFKIQEEGAFIGCNNIIKIPEIRKNLKYFFFGHGYMQRNRDDIPIWGNYKREVDTLDKNIQKFAMVSRDNDIDVHGFTSNVIKNLKRMNAIPCDMNLDKLYKNLERRPFLNHSIVFPAIQFAMYAGFKKIYLVGCDCNGYFRNNSFIDGARDRRDVDRQLTKRWVNILEFKNLNYSDCSIININPVGLEGMMDGDIFV